MGDKKVLKGNSASWQKRQQAIAQRAADRSLLSALACKDVECVAYALDHLRADPNTKVLSRSEQPAMHSAIRFTSPGNQFDVAATIECLKLLLDHGANVNMRDEYGETAICIAIDHDSAPIVRLLIDAGAS